MTRTFWRAEIWRWLFAGIAAVAAHFAAVYIGLFVHLGGPFPKDLAAPTAGFLAGSLPVLAGSFLAPRHRCTTAVVLFVACTAVGALLFSFHLAAASVGGVCAVGIIAAWFHPRRTRRSSGWLGLAVAVAAVAFATVVYARYRDWPARPARLPLELTQILGTHAAPVVALHRYDLGGFIDHEWLWRIDAKPDVVALVISGLELRPTDFVPARFWRMPPHYWPRFMPAGAAAFQSPSFSADQRGPDGPHYFLIYDKARGRAYVWFKNNF